MRTLLDDMERSLTDLLQMGLATAGPEMAKRLEEVSRRCGDTGLHTGAALMGELAGLLTQRSHAMDKTDLTLMAAICRTEHYITLCRTRMTEEDIRKRWQEGGTA
ncbi:MAG: hypothetical protein IJX04_09935 [Oscillospiraceae bacterium]|nr:hypothetical protein [Oscillospiraceae bacterium]